MILRQADVREAGIGVVGAGYSANRSRWVLSNAARLPFADLVALRFQYSDFLPNRRTAPLKTLCRGSGASRFSTGKCHFPREKR
jgi:hypothetical protein